MVSESNFPRQHNDAVACVVSREKLSDVKFSKVITGFCRRLKYPRPGYRPNRPKRGTPQPITYEHCYALILEIRTLIYFWRWPTLRFEAFRRRQ